MKKPDVQEVCERAMGSLYAEWDDDAATVLSLGELRKIVEEAFKAQRELLQPMIDAAAQMDRSMVHARSELWRLLDIKGVEPLAIGQWPEIESLDKAGAAYRAAYRNALNPEESGR